MYFKQGHSAAFMHFSLTSQWTRKPYRNRWHLIHKFAKTSTINVSFCPYQDIDRQKIIIGIIVLKMELRILQLNEDKSDKLFATNACQTLLEMYDEYYRKIGFNLPWVSYLVIRQDQVIGTCSFTGQPKDGKVEIAYWTFKEFEGQGVATFACKELISIAKSTDPKVTITAKTSPEHNASTKVLRNFGFIFTDIVQDDEIGDSWLWALKPDEKR